MNLFCSLFPSLPAPIFMQIASRYIVPMTGTHTYHRGIVQCIVRETHTHMYSLYSTHFPCVQATDLVQVLQKLSKISKSKKSHRPQDTLRSVNSPVQKKVPKFQLPIRAGIFEEEGHNPLETKSLSTLSHRETRALSLGPSSKDLYHLYCIALIHLHREKFRIP